MYTTSPFWTYTVISWSALKSDISVTTAVLPVKSYTRTSSDIKYRLPFTVSPFNISALLAAEFAAYSL